jgi:hypothetical protein
MKKNFFSYEIGRPVLVRLFESSMCNLSNFDPQFSKTFQPLPIKHSTAICLEELSRWVVLILLAMLLLESSLVDLATIKRRVISNVAQLGLFHRVGKKKGSESCESLPLLVHVDLLSL